jgi:hypothetical protein
MKRAALYSLSSQFIVMSAYVLMNVYSFSTSAQVTQLSDYVMFSGNAGTGTTAPGSDGYGVIFGSSSTITGGTIGSYRLVKTTGGADMTTNIYSGGLVQLANGNSVSGRTTAQNLYPAPISGTVLQAGSNAVLSGVIDANGNVVVQSGTVTGPVHTTGTYTGPTPTNPVSNAVSFPTLPTYPDAIIFPAAGATNISNTTTINPGSYGNVSMGNNKILTLNGPGIYTFNSINNSSNNSIIYNFNNQDGVIKVYVHGDAIMGKVNASIINGGSAQKIYWEIHGSGATSSSHTDAFVISNGSSGNGTVKFSGTVNAYNAAILIGSGSGSSSFTGAMWSRTRVQVQTGVNLVWSFYSPCTPPAANAGNDATFCAGSTANLGSAPVAGNTYSWSPTTGLSDPNIANPTVTLNIPGPTIYTVTVTSGLCSNADQVTVMVNALPTVTISASGGTTFCQGGSVTLTSSAGSSYLWSNGATSQAITVSSSGNYSVRITNSGGCSATSTATSVTVNPLPTATISAGGSTTFCQGGSVTLTSSAGSSYLWSNAATSQSITASSSGSYSVRVTNANGCSATSTSTSVTVNPLPTATISAGGSTTFCQGGSVTLTSSAGSTYLWSNGSTSQTISASTSGSYSVRVTDANGCSATSTSTSVTVNPLPSATISTGGPTTFCQGGSVTLTSSAGSSYLWSNSATSQSITVSVSGSYSVRVTDANGCSATSTSTSVTVNPLPTATVSAGGSTTFCQGGSVTLTSSAGSSYSWSNGSTSQSIIVSATGSYSVTVYNANGCSATSTSTSVTVNPLPTVTADAVEGCSGSSIALSGTPSGGTWSVANPYIGGPTTYTHSYTDVNGCSNTSAPASITVYDRPSVSMDTYGPVCVGASSFTLNGTPANGTFSGPGVSGTTFNPAAAGIGTHSVTYSFTDEHGCTSSASTSIQVTALPAVSINSVGSLCTNGSDVSLTGTPSGGTFSGSYVTANTFSPSTAGIGSYTITYIYNNGSCSNSTTASIIVNGIPDVHAGSGYQMNCNDTIIQLHGNSSTAGALFSWNGSNGGHISLNGNSANPTIDGHGHFALTVTDPSTNCSNVDEVNVPFDPCIFPGYTPPAQGKSDNLIGSELTQLYYWFLANGCTNPNEDIFIIIPCQVLVEIVYQEGERQNLFDILTAAPYNVADTIDNGGRNRILTCFVAVDQLLNLNNLNITENQHIINHVRPVYRPVPTANSQDSTGIAYSLGDVAQRSDIARKGFKVDGTGVKVGVISNSYNTQPGNHAGIDVVNGDLPGLTNPYGYTTPVQLVGPDYLYGVLSDEGRAMLQIVHDVAPAATLAFANGFVSAGNMAQKIRQLQAAGCNIGVDDITYITEPYFHDGMIATAVNDVAALGMTYFTAAGNYGEKSYEGFYNPVDASDLIPVGTAHNFRSDATVDRFQNITVGPGSYLLVLQWEDDFYSVDLATGGTTNDMDIYLTYNNGRTLFGFNRNNIGGDPIEVVPFTVTMPTTTNVLVTRESGSSPNVHFKYILFKTPPPPALPALPNNFIINEYNTGNSTIVGQANSAGAITLGAIRYSNTPEFPANDLTLTKATFSSIGGTLIHNNPIPREKPDLVAPNAANTTVELGGLNEDPPLHPEGDDFPNFVGTSAAAPHAAAIGALLLDAKQRYYHQTLTPSEIRNLLTGTATDMYSPGFDFLSGYGLVNAYAAMETFAAPVPVLVSLENVPPGYEPGDTVPSFTLTVTANFITPLSKVVFREDTLETTYLDEHHLSAVIPQFYGNPPVEICTHPIAGPLYADGGCSNVLYILSGVKKDVIVTADNLTKKFGEKLPVEGNPCPPGFTCYSATVTVNGQSPEDAGLTLADLGLENIHYALPVGTTSMSNTGIYFIAPSADVSDAGLQELYNYTFTNGHLTIQKMPLVITPHDLTVVYGDKIDGTTIDFSYSYDETNILPAEQSQFLSDLQDTYEPSIVKDVALIDDRDEFNSSTLSESDIINLALLSGGRGIINGGRGIINGGRGIINSTTPDTTYVVDLTYESLVEYNGDGSVATLYDDVLLLNGGRGIINGGRGIANSAYVTDGSAVINGGRSVANGGRSVANGGRGIINAEELDGVSNTNTAIIIHETDLDDVAEENPDSTFQLYAINGITGLTAGEHWIIPGGFLSANFEVTYGLGHLHIDPYELTVKADDKTSEYGTAPSYSSTITGYQYDDDVADVFSNSASFTPAGQINVGTYPIVPGGLTLIQPSNYSLTANSYVNGELNVTPATLTATADDKSRPYGYNNPALTITYSGFKYSDNEGVISPSITASTTAIVSSTPGGYPITLSPTGTASNYTIVRIPGTLTVEAAARSCSINSPASLPLCNTTGNTLTANADAGYNYNWTVSGTGWLITSGNGNLSITYTSGASGTSGIFTLNVTAPITGYLISSCTLTIGTICGVEYCTYGQGSWGTAGGQVCNGMTTSAVIPTLMTTSLVSGDGSRKITFGTTESSCLITKLPAGQTSAQLPVGNVNCAGATGGNYLNSGKFKSNLLGQQIALELSCRYNPSLRGLHITGPFVTTYNATSCSNGSAVAGSQHTYSLVPAVVSYLGANNTVNDLILLANKGLGGTLSNGAPSLSDISNTISNFLLAFNQCKILGGFSSIAGRDVINPDAEGNAIKNIFFYPNPTSGNITVSFVAAQGSHAILDIFNVSGSLVSRALDKTMNEDGIYSFEVDCSSFSKGVYFMRLSVDEETSQGKLVIIK